MVKQGSHKASLLLPDSAGGAALDGAFEGSSRQRPWLIWVLIAIPMAVLVAFAAWPGSGVSGGTAPTAVGSDAAWSGVIRRERPRSAMPAATLTPASLQPAPAAAQGFVGEAPAKPGLDADSPAKLSDSTRSEAEQSERQTRLTDSIAQIQLLLTDRGYAPGPVDGLPGKRTTDAIMKWQLDQGLIVDPAAFDDVLQMLDHRKQFPSTGRRLSYRSLSSHERSILDNWCSAAVSREDSPAFYQCLGVQLGLMRSGLRMPVPGSDSTRLVATAHAACVTSLKRNPQKYFACIGKQLAGHNPDMAPIVSLK